ncbi:MAG TPA: FixH family protein, partial [bacterium]
MASSLESPNRTKYRDTMVWLVAGIFAAYLVTNGIMLAFAMRSPPTLVSQTYYEDARAFEASRDAEEATTAAGWRVTAQSPTAREVVVQVTDRAGRPASGFSGDVSAYRPSDPGLDQPLAWTEDVAKPGQYRAIFARPHPGQWHI